MNSVPCNLKTHSLYWTVKSRLIYTYGKEPTITELKKLAQEIHLKHDIAISRDTKRSKELIICWMCDNWSIVQNHLRVIQNDYLNDPNNVIVLSKCSKEKKQKLMKEYLLRDKMIQTENNLKKIFNCTKLSMNELRNISDKICKQTNFKLNRNEKRDKLANLAWFTSNWNIIEPLISNDAFVDECRRDNEVQWTNDISNEQKAILFPDNNFSENEFDEYFLQESILL
ncbi:hypothetical protein M9Y10_015195 [Tritrichomonas musculus]|uniref:Uncharacterized protein n=1 Tax=Tritrichomonas musculus TaxID=1915356 RepID=A0ABR2L2N4_9EUKA